MTNSARGLDNAWAKASEPPPSPEEAADLARRRREDFDFMVVCASKGNMAMYHLMRDRSLDDAPQPLRKVK